MEPDVRAVLEDHAQFKQTRKRQVPCGKGGRVVTMTEPPTFHPFCFFGPYFVMTPKGDHLLVPGPLGN